MALLAIQIIITLLAAWMNNKDQHGEAQKSTDSIRIAVNAAPPTVQSLMMIPAQGARNPLVVRPLQFIRHVGLPTGQERSGKKSPRAASTYVHWPYAPGVAMGDLENGYRAHNKADPIRSAWIAKMNLNGLRGAAAALTIFMTRLANLSLSAGVFFVVPVCGLIVNNNILKLKRKAERGFLPTTAAAAAAPILLSKAAGEIS